MDLEFRCHVFVAMSRIERVRVRRTGTNTLMDVRSTICKRAGQRPIRLVIAEGQGFEPWRSIPAPSGFQDRRHRPLGEPSNAGPGEPDSSGTSVPDRGSSRGW
jgi:hypothetical protein